MPAKFDKVSVIGLGYVGLPTAALLAKHKILVVGVDTRIDVVDSINLGKTHIVEPDLGKLVQSNVASGYLRAVTEPETSDVFIISVPTPFKHDRTPDVSYLKKAVEALAPKITIGNLIILESTSPVGTTEQIRDWLAILRQDLKMPGKSPKSDIFIAHSPERVFAGRKLKELSENDRVIGGITSNCSQLASSFYETFISGKCHLTDSRTAELVKLSENAFRDINIAYANELSSVCNELGINIWKLVALANQHPRVNILNPGPGVGGHCVAVDPWFIVNSAPAQTPLIQAARSVNDGKPDLVVEQILSKINSANSPNISCLGLSYKADTDDIRESPGIKIVKSIAQKFDGTIFVCEPNISKMPEPLKEFKTISLQSIDVCLNKSKIIVLLTDHKEFLEVTSDMLKEKIVLDTRGVWETK